MIDIVESLKSAGVYPIGPASAWPIDRHHELLRAAGQPVPQPIKARKVHATPRQMAKGLVTTAFQAVTHGAVSPEIRDLRYATCESCPSFIHQSKRCSECGCFMEAKTWVNGNKDQLCPLKKWAR